MKFSGIRVKTLRLFLLQNNSVTFCSYLPFLPQPSLSPQTLLCARLSALCACISERQRQRTRVDLALVQEVYMLSPGVTTTLLFKHNTDQGERE